eukprot:3069810-Rhodomonas_salina.2
MHHLYARLRNIRVMPQHKCITDPPIVHIQMMRHHTCITDPSIAAPRCQRARPTDRSVPDTMIACRSTQVTTAMFAIAEFIQNPCRQNQRVLVDTRLCACANEILELKPQVYT